MFGLDGAQPADTRTHDHAKTVPVDRFEVEARIGDRLHPCRDAVVHEWIDAARFLGRQVGRHVEAAHRATKAHRKCAGVKACDRTDAALAAQYGRPDIGHAAA